MGGAYDCMPKILDYKAFNHDKVIKMQKITIKGFQKHKRFLGF